MCLSAGGRGAGQAGTGRGQLLVGVDPALAGGVVERDRARSLGEAQRQAYRVADLGEPGAVERAAERQELGALDRDEQEAIGEPVRQLGRGQVTKQLIAGDVTDDADARAGRAQRVVAHDRLQRFSVPRLADDRRQRVAFAREHLQRLGELRLDHEPPLVRGRLAVVFVSGVADLGDQPFPGR